MAAEPNAVEQAVSRTLRDNLEKIQRTADELHKAVNDMVSACASSRASNALPSMLRAQTSAASLSATLEVLSRFVTSALQPAMRMPFEPDILSAPSPAAPPIPAFEQPPPPPSHPIEEFTWATPVPAVPPPPVSEIPPPVEHMPPVPEVHSPVETPAFSDISPAAETPKAVEPAAALEPVVLADPVPVSLDDPALDLETVFPIEAQPAVQPPPVTETVEAAPVFNLDSLPPEEQELHRRAFRVAKVSMQDIRMLRPEDVRMGREKKDLCFRLRDDIEKAHKEYDRRFQAIQSHPVDYFYDWMVEILGGGDPQALGEYPYRSPVLRR
ncbi:MAG TPA: hypothetical protein VGP19_03875 [Candidatus Acidoferrales bacterium]|jgi:hypothetical protein|nr:hypothetical protein [Candidatus Acidoferrales bacterium]